MSNEDGYKETAKLTHKVLTKRLHDAFDDLDDLIDDGRIIEALVDEVIKGNYPELEDDWADWKSGT